MNSSKRTAMTTFMRMMPAISTYRTKKADTALLTPQDLTCQCVLVFTRPCRQPHRGGGWKETASERARKRVGAEQERRPNGFFLAAWVPDAKDFANDG